MAPCTDRAAWRPALWRGAQLSGGRGAPLSGGAPGCCAASCVMLTNWVETKTAPDAPAGIIEFRYDRGGGQSTTGAPQRHALSLAGWLDAVSLAPSPPASSGDAELVDGGRLMAQPPRWIAR